MVHHKGVGLTCWTVCRYIPAMAAGEKVGAIAMTEPDAGSDLQGIRTRAVADGDDYILNGSKVFITNGILSDVVVRRTLGSWQELRAAAAGPASGAVRTDPPWFLQNFIVMDAAWKLQVFTVNTYNC